MHAATVFLGVDIGGTGARWVLQDATGDHVAAGTGPPASGSPRTPRVTDGLVSCLGVIRSEVACVMNPDRKLGAAFIGLTGAGLRPQADRHATCAAALGLDADRLWLVSDVLLAHAAAFDGGPGLLVQAGTGSAGFAVDGHQRAILVGGYGLPGGDPGSAVAIAIAGIAAVCAETDRTGGNTASALTRELLAATGTGDSRTLAAHARTADRGALGLYAMAVARAADAGDVAARNILHAAGRDLAAIAIVLCQRVAPAPLAISGRAASLHDALRDGLMSTLEAERPQGLAVPEPLFVPDCGAETAARLARFGALDPTAAATALPWTSDCLRAGAGSLLGQWDCRTANEDRRHVE